MAIWAALLLAALTTRAAAVTYEPEPAFCKRSAAASASALSPLARMPKLHQPAKSGRLGFGPSSLRLWTTSRLQVGRALVGFTLGLNQRQGMSLPWTAKTTMIEVNGNGHPIGKPRRMIRRLGRLKPFYGDDFQFVVPDDPAFYRTTILLTGASGKWLGKFSFYTRMAEPAVAARLTLNASTYKPESTLFMRVENLGDLNVSYGVDYRVEKLEGATWVTAPENPHGVVIMIGLSSPPESSGPCVQFQVPPTTAPGTHRIVKEVTFLPPHPPRGRAIGPAPQRTLTAEFGVLP